MAGLFSLLGEGVEEEWRAVENGGMGPPPGQEAPPAADPTGPVEGGFAGGGQGKAPERGVTSYLMRILPDVTGSSGLLEVVEVISASDPEVSRAGVRGRGV